MLTRYCEFEMLSLEFVKCWPDICFCLDSDWFDKSEEPDYSSGEVEHGPNSVQYFSVELDCGACCPT